MNFADRKIEIGFGVAVVLFIGSMGWMFAGGSKGISGRMEDLVYEMPRPKSFISSLFELGDRSVSREYKNPFEKSKVKSALAKEKIADAKKAEDPKKKIAQKSKPTVKPQGIKKNFDVKVVAAANNKAAFEGLSDSYGAMGAAAYNNSKTGDKSTDNLNKMSGSQWRALLQADPNEENLSKFLLAYSRGEVDSNTYFQIVSDLMLHNQKQVQELGVIALHANYSSQGFMTATKMLDVVDVELKSKLYSYLQNYSVTGRLEILAAVLTSSDVPSVMLATQIVVEGYQAAKSGSSLNNDPRTIRGDGKLGYITSYGKFVPIFKTLENSSDAGVASQASAALSQIQTSVAAL